VPEDHAGGSAVQAGPETGTAPPRRWRVTPRSLRVGGGYLLGAAIGIVAWQIVGWHSQQQIFVPLTSTLHKLGVMVSDGTLGGAMANSFATFGVGVLIALIMGALGGLVLARSELIRTAFEPYIMALYAAPMVALIPFLLAFMGFTFWSKSIVVALFAFFPVLLNTQRGAQSIAPELLDVARLYRSSERNIWIHVIAPYTLPFFMTGVRQALARGLVGMIAADIFLSANGLGGLLISASQFFDTAEMLATILVITASGVVLMAIGNLIERRFARWRVDQ